MKEFRILIAGRLVTGAATIDVLNPATEEALSPPSRQRSATERSGRGDEGCLYPMVAVSMERARHVLTRSTDALEARIDEFVTLLTAAQDKPQARAREEVLGSIAVLREFAKMEFPAENHPGSRRGEDGRTADSTGRGRRAHSVKLPDDLMALKADSCIDGRKHDHREAGAKTTPPTTATRTSLGVSGEQLTA